MKWELIWTKLNDFLIHLIIKFQNFYIFRNPPFEYFFFEKVLNILIKKFSFMFFFTFSKSSLWSTAVI